MKLVACAISALFVSGLANANPGVTKNTDIGKRDVKSHYQVTRCESNGECTINSVTKFNKKSQGKKIFSGDCVWNEVDGMRVQECKTKPNLKKKRIVKRKVVKELKKNRIQVHLGYGPDGQTVDEDSNNTVVKERRRAVGGLQYTRLLNDDYSIGLTGFTNKTVTLTFGIDFD